MYYISGYTKGKWQELTDLGCRQENGNWIAPTREIMQKANDLLDDSSNRKLSSARMKTKSHGRKDYLKAWELRKKPKKKKPRMTNPKGKTKFYSGDEPPWN